MTNILSDKAYDILKWVIVIVLPAISTAILGLGEIFGFGWASDVAQVLTIVQTLLGTIFCISAATYTSTDTVSIEDFQD